MRKLSLIILAFVLLGYSNSFAQASKLRVMITPYDSLHATLMVVDTVVSIGDTTYFLDFTKFLGGSSLNFVDSSGVSGVADTILVTIPFPQIQNYADTLNLRLLLSAFADSVANIDSTYITNNSLGFEDINNLVTVLATKMFSSAFVDSLNNTHTITSDWTFDDSVSIDTLNVEGLINIDSTEIPNDNIGFEDVNNLPELLNLKTDSSDVISLIAGSLSVYTPTLALDESLATKFPLNAFGDSTAAIDSTYITNDKLGFEDVNNLPEIMDLKMPLSSFGDSTGAIDSTYITNDALGFEDVNNLSSIMTSKTDSGETSALIGDSLGNYSNTVEVKALTSDSLQAGTALVGATSQVTGLNDSLNLKTDSTDVISLFRDSLQVIYGDSIAGKADVSMDSLVAYYPLDTNSKDYSDNTNNGTDTAIDYVLGDVAGDWANFDGATGMINVGSDASIDDIWDGGGSISFTFDANSDGEGDNGRFFHKTVANGGWNLRTSSESGGFVEILFVVLFDGANGQWSIPNVSLSQLHHLTLTYDIGSLSNDPIFKLDGVVITPTETSTPVGTSNSDASADLFFGNQSTDNFTLDGKVGEIRILREELPDEETTKLYLNSKHLHDMQTAVDLNATETIGGVKTFSDSSHFDGNVVIDSNLVVNGGFDLNPAFIHVFTTDSVGVTVTTANDEVHLANTFAVGNAGSSQFTLLTDSLKYTGTDSIVVAVEIDLGTSISQANQHAQWKLFHNSAAIGDEIFIGRDFSSASKVGVVSMHGHVRLGMNDVLYIIATVTSSDGKTLGHEHVMFSVLEIKKIIQ